MLAYDNSLLVGVAKKSSSSLSIKFGAIICSPLTCSFNQPEQKDTSSKLKKQLLE